MELKGFYLDGQTAEKRDAVVWMEQNGLRIDLGPGGSFLWPYAEIRQNKALSRSKQIRLEKGGPLPEILLVPRAGFFAGLKQIFPKIPRQFHDRASFSLRVTLPLTAALGAAGIVLSLYLWGIPILSGWATAKVPVSWEETLGRSIVEGLAPEARRCSDPAQEIFLRQIMEALNSPRPERPYKFRVIIVNDPEVNAFAAPGGTIVVFRGLLEKIKTTEELAGVLSHEMQHILYRHSTRMILENVSLRLLLSVFRGDVNSAMSVGKEGVGLLATLRYSRQFEEQADAEGMRLIRAVGIDPQGMISFFEGIQKEERSISLPAYFSTHPKPESRIRRLKTLAGEAPAAPIRPLPVYYFRNSKAICANQNPPAADASSLPSSWKAKIFGRSR
jgi:beta-barrel assembly-enhancing protease